jgi:hypothetical protein
MATPGLVRRLPGIEQVDQLCEACLAGKKKRASFPQWATRRTTRSLERPITQLRQVVKKYSLLLVDDFGRYMWISLLPSKDCAATEIKRIQAAVERKTI